MSGAAEPLSDFARSILRAIAVYPVQQHKVVPAVRDILLARGFIKAGVLSRHDVYEATDAGRQEAGVK